MKIKPIMLAITMISLFAVTIVSIGNDNNNNAMMNAYAQGGPSACPDPGQCTCNARFRRDDRLCYVATIQSHKQWLHRARDVLAYFGYPF